jgi:hypothetical protein
MPLKSSTRTTTEIDTAQSKTSMMRSRLAVKEWTLACDDME